MSTPASDRLVTIDLIRGIALLGLPLMNIIAFSMPLSAYLNPNAYLADAPLNHLLFSIFHLFADQKFMGLFSLLFGASILMFSERLNETGRSATKVHYIRNFLLLVFGFLHLWYIWSGDILMAYAFCGFILYPLRLFSARAMFALFLVFMALSVLISHVPDFIGAQASADAMRDANYFFQPDTAQLAEQAPLVLGDYQTLVESVRAEFLGEPSGFGGKSEALVGVVAFSSLLRAFAMMALGMGLYRLGVLQGRKSQRFYQRLAHICLPLGLIIVGSGLWFNYQHNWQLNEFMAWGMVPNLVGTVAVVLGYVALSVLWQQSNKLNRLKRYVQATGKMALTNYLMQSIVCAFVFYGYGLGWYGRLSRVELLAIVLVIGTCQLIFSKLWLTYFNFDPFEWLWRMLTYFKWLNPLKVRTFFSVAAAPSGEIK